MRVGLVIIGNAWKVDGNTAARGLYERQEMQTKMFKEMMPATTVIHPHCVFNKRKLELEWCGQQLGQSQVPCAEVRQAFKVQ